MEEHNVLFERMIKYMTIYIETHENDYQAIEQEHTNILTALEKAFQHGMDREFLYRP